MTKNALPRRRARYFTLSSQIAHLDNAQVRSLLAGTEMEAGWARNHTINIGRSKVFVKRVPVTDIEYENMFSTANLYNLPMYYNYGVGSAGLSVFRELVMHIKTTNWVLEGAIENFPLMYHYRLITFSGPHAAVDMERHNSYVAYWGSNKNVGRYVLDRANAKYELVLFLEHMPYVLEPWLYKNLKQLQGVLDEIQATIAFLRTQGIVHFDAHFFNILSDGERIYLTDFGLVLDKQFGLTKDEAAFLKHHTYFDYGEVLWSLDFLMLQAFEALSDAEKRVVSDLYTIPEGARAPVLMPILLSNIEHLHTDGLLKLDAGYVATMIKYRSVVTLMQNFMGAMIENKKKDTPFPNTRLQRLLRETGFLT